VVLVVENTVAHHEEFVKQGSDLDAFDGIEKH
jgi:hypothetical protein